MGVGSGSDSSRKKEAIKEVEELKQALFRSNNEIELLRKRVAELEPGQTSGDGEPGEELRRARAELARQKSLLDSILRQMSAGVIAAEAPSGRIISVNAQAEEICRHSFFPAHRILWRDHFKGFHPDGRPYEPEEWPLERSLSSGEIVADEEIGFIRGDSTQGTILVRSSPILDSDGHITAATMVFFDITGQKLIEETLRRSEVDLRQTFDEAPIGAAVVGLDFRFELVNEALCRITGYSKEELTSLTFMDITHPHDLAVDLANTERMQTNGMDRFQMEKRYIRKDGRTVWVNLHARLVRDVDGKPLYYLPMIEDITDRKEAEESLMKAHAELEQRVLDRTAQLMKANEELNSYAERLNLLNQELQEFLFIASHDLQEPLRKMQTFASLIRDKYQDTIDEWGQGHLNRIIHSGKKMQALLCDLLDYSRMTSRPAVFVQTDLSLLAEEVVGDLVLLIEDTGADVKVLKIPTAEVEPLQMRFVFQHLISNALKYRGEQKPVVKVHGVCCENGACQIFVEDNGIGFDDAFVDRIFRPFQRLHGRQSAYDGTGMGLAICRKIVQRHSGSITARSAPGKGSTFIVTLPLRQRWKDEKKRMKDEKERMKDEKERMKGEG